MSATTRIIGIVTRIDPIKQLNSEKRADAAVINFKVECTNGFIWSCSIYRNYDASDNLMEFIKNVHVNDEVSILGNLKQSSWFDESVKRRFTKYVTDVKTYECLKNDFQEQVSLIL